MTKETIHPDLSIINMYALNNRASKYTKQIFIELKGGRENSSITTVGDFNIPLSVIEYLDRGSISKERTSDRCVYNTSSNQSRIRHHVKCTWDVLQDRPYVMS